MNIIMTLNIIVPWSWFRAKTLLHPKLIERHIIANELKISVIVISAYSAMWLVLDTVIQLRIFAIYINIPYSKKLFIESNFESNFSSGLSLMFVYGENDREFPMTIGC